MQLVAAARQYLMGVRLMPDIPNKPVIWRVENIMHRDRQFDRSETRTGMAANPRTCIDNELTHFIRNLLQILDTQLAQISG